MFCGKCGTNIGDGSAPCPNCSVAEAPVAEAPVTYAPEASVSYDMGEPANDKPTAGIFKDKKKLGIIGGALVVIIAIIVILIVTLSGGSAQSRLETYLDFYFNAKGDAEEFIEIRYPESSLDELLDFRNMTYDEYIDDLKDNQKEELEELAYDGVSYTFEFVREKAMKSSDIDEFNEEAEEYGFVVSDGMVFRVKVHKFVDGEETKVTTYEYKMVEVDGDWYYGSGEKIS